MHCSLWINVLLVWLACPREGYFDGYHTIKVKHLNTRNLNRKFYKLFFSILSIVEPGDARTFLFLSIVGHYSLFPLLFPPELTLVKLLLFILYSMYAFYSLSQLYPFQFCKYTLPLLNIFESIYLLGFCVIFFYENILHNFIGLDKHLPFLPLMLTSVYCSLGVIYSWLRYYLYFIFKCE